ncbi:hypothetical protein BdWA1_003183 [Babesia duncani]|uniref:Uncharacterized protein n=1 Tax=Babesia duncani TaxID=323732 RepID=A0AAD9UN88_9APIC|nr:hypothetical protein BdWA1_003183 [Babesia duncani]
MAKANKTIGDLRKLAKQGPNGLQEKKRDPVHEFQQLQRTKPGLPKTLQNEIEKRNIKSVDQVKKIAMQIRNKRMKSVRNEVKPHHKHVNKKQQVADFSVPSGKIAKKFISNMKQIAQHINL